MKLVYKNILINTLISVFILFAGEYTLYFFLKNKIEKETIEHLSFEAYIVNHQLNEGVPINAFQHNIGDILDIMPIQKVEYTTPIIKDVVIAEEEEEHEREHEEHHEDGQKYHKQEESFTSKQVVFDVSLDSKNYRISIIKTVDEDEGLAGSMSAIIFISGFCMLTILVLINVFVYHKLFAPVYQIIKDVKEFSIQKLKSITPPTTSTKEFITLGKEISKMSEKMISDYSSVKEFMENVTHEIQTPLAVINTKIERCLQDKHLTEEQAILLTDASKAANKLFMIHKGLSLLCKLDNKQYNEPVDINIGQLIHQRVQYFLDFSENKNITITENYVNELTLVMDSVLSEILIDNLIKNAIQHNVQNGNIYLTVENNQFIIANTGEVPKGPTSSYFDRFYSQKPYQSLGLGLSIIKKIVGYYNYSISYNYEGDLHKIIIDFSTKN